MLISEQNHHRIKVTIIYILHVTLQFEQFIESRKHRTQIMGMRDIVQLYTMVQQIMYA